MKRSLHESLKVERRLTNHLKTGTLKYRCTRSYHKILWQSVLHSGLSACCQTHQLCKMQLHRLLRSLIMVTPTCVLSLQLIHQPPLLRSQESGSTPLELGLKLHTQVLSPFLCTRSQLIKQSRNIKSLKINSQNLYFTHKIIKRKSHR